LHKVRDLIPILPRKAVFCWAELTVNNSSGGYVPDGGSTAWGGIGMLNNTAPAGAHMHTVAGTATISTGGGGKSIDNRSAYLVVNTFIYLGE
jgi:hypothetical protein